MSTKKRLRFEIEIAAPPRRVFALLIDPEAYRDWTTPFAEGSYYEGTWALGETIRFMAPGDDGMLSEIAEHRPGEFTSIRHLGMIRAGAVDTQSEAVRAWAPAFENYTLEPVPGGTRLLIDQDATDDFAGYLMDAWPKALQRLKARCEQVPEQ